MTTAIVAQGQRAIPRPLVVHVVHRWGVGGAELGVVNFIRRLVPGPLDHAVVSVVDGDSSLVQRLASWGVSVHSMGKQPGQDWGLYGRFYRLFRRLAPTVVHSHNLAALEAQPMAWWAGVPVRVHNEHGRDLADLTGASRRYTWLRRALRPFVQAYIPVSQDLARWLAAEIKVPEKRLVQIYNGVDTERFRPRRDGEPRRLPPGFAEDALVVGTVGRLVAIKHQRALVAACARLMALAEHHRLRLIIVGDGPLKDELAAQVAAANLERRVCLAGNRDDVDLLLRSFDVFVLPSLSEGISYTLLEAMASGLPVIATAVGGNPELVADGRTGQLVPVDDVDALAQSIATYALDPSLRRSHGAHGRSRCEAEFSIDQMTARYLALYHRLGVAEARQGAFGNGEVIRGDS
ncbi:MAG: TIGR03088 family PEP-CTERM/XrtA system glycosyltransferase [Candidatus Competibacterales bacterium]